MTFTKWWRLRRSPSNCEILNKISSGIFKTATKTKEKVARKNRSRLTSCHQRASRRLLQRLHRGRHVTRSLADTKTIIREDNWDKFFISTQEERRRMQNAQTRQRAHQRYTDAELVVNNMASGFTWKLRAFRSRVAERMKLKIDLVLEFTFKPES